MVPFSKYTHLLLDSEVAIFIARFHLFPTPSFTWLNGKF